MSLFAQPINAYRTQGVLQSPITSPCLLKSRNQLAQCLGAQFLQALLFREYPVAIVSRQQLTAVKVDRRGEERDLPDTRSTFRRIQCTFEFHDVRYYDRGI